MYAIVDCNSFYCSCERLFRPDLQHKPVVVLSNNDGCIVSRTDEAKALGIPMAVPFFEYKKILDEKDVAVFSSNYNLYGDLSNRVMDVLRSVVGNAYVEVYSVDEAFIDLSSIAAADLHDIIVALKTKVELWTGIKVSVGVAPTKTLSKVANRLAKKNKLATNCILVLDTKEKLVTAMQQTAIADVWGVGRQYARKLQETFAIYTAYELSQMSESFAHTYMGGVVGKRLIRELNGIPSIIMKDPLVTKKMIATTRMFGDAVSNIKEIKEAVATYTSRAAEKLRRQYSVAQEISVFVVAKQTDYNNTDFRGNTYSAYSILTHATADTAQLIKTAMPLVDAIVQDGKPYKKAGVTLSRITPDQGIQGNLFATYQPKNNKKLMQAIDNINFSQRDDVLKFAASGTVRNWKMRQNLISKRYTTRWNEIMEVQ
jgi:DNA polymerase V